MAEMYFVEILAEVFKQHKEDAIIAIVITA
jgi:hypothetical protein